MEIRAFTLLCFARAAGRRAAYAAAAVLVLAAAAPGRATASQAPAVEGTPSQSEGSETPTGARSGGRDGARAGVVHGAERIGCGPTIEVSAAEVIAGEAVTVSGAVRCYEGSEPGGQTITLFEHSAGGSSGFAAVASTTSAADGSYEFAPPPLEEKATFFVRLGRWHSARRRVRVAPQISLVAPPDGSQLAAGNRGGGDPATNTVTFTGSVTPATPGEFVVLQREIPAGSGLWRRIAVARVDEAGHYVITHTFHRAGEATVRILVRSRGVLAPAASRPLTYTIAPQQRRRSAKTARESGTR